MRPAKCPHCREMLKATSAFCPGCNRFIDFPADGGEGNSMKPEECFFCREMTPATDLYCNNCGRSSEDAPADGGEGNSMRPAECPQCGEMIEATDLKCNYCNLTWLEWPDGWLAFANIVGKDRIYDSEGNIWEWNFRVGTYQAKSDPLNAS